MVGMDADFLTCLLHPNPRLPRDPKTNKPVERARERVQYLVTTLEKAREKIIIPTPVLSEVLALAMDKAPDYLTELTGMYGVEVAAFDQVAAIEAALAVSEAKRRGGKKGGAGGTWAKVKFDRQIVAICKVRGVAMLYSNDEDVHKFAKQAGIAATALWDLPEPPPEQTEMFE